MNKDLILVRAQAHAKAAKVWRDVLMSHRIISTDDEFLYALNQFSKHYDKFKEYLIDAYSR